MIALVLTALVSGILTGPHVSLAAGGVVPEGDALSQAAISHIAAVTPWKDAEIQIVPMGNVSGTDVPHGNVTYRVNRNTPVNTFKGLLLPIEVSADGIPLRTFWIQVNVVVRARVVRATRRLLYGSTISPEDVTEALTEISSPHSEYLSSSPEAIGKVLRRTLSPGDPLTRESIANPYLVRSGETVRLLLRNGSVNLAMMARAEQNGRLGQIIRVRNFDFSKEVKALVTARGEVRIE